MSKGQRQRVKYMLLAVIGIIKLYLRAADVSELSAKPSDTLECSKEEKTGPVFNNAQLREEEQMLAEQDAKKTEVKPPCSIGNTKSTAAHTENANPNKQKELCTLEGMVDTESIAEKEDSSASALDVPESRNLEHSNSTGELAEYAMDKKNSSNLVVDKKEESMAKNEVDAAIEADTVEMEILMKMKRRAEMERQEMLMKMERRAEMERQEMQERRAEMEIRAEMKRLAEMKDAAKLAKDVLETKSREFGDARQKCNKHTTIYNKKIKEINPITEKINSYYGDPSDLRTADNADTKQNKLIKRICILTSEISTLIEEIKKITSYYKITADSMKKIEKSAPFTRKIIMEYNLLGVKAEKIIIDVIQRLSEKHEKIRERDALFYYMRKNESNFFKNMRAVIHFFTVRPFELFEDSAGINTPVIGLYIARIELTTEVINAAANMLAMQKISISKAVEKEQAYRSYDAAESACEEQQRVVNEAKKAMRAAEECYKDII